MPKEQSQQEEEQRIKLEQEQYFNAEHLKLIEHGLAVLTRRVFGLPDRPAFNVLDSLRPSLCVLAVRGVPAEARKIRLCNVQAETGGSVPCDNRGGQQSQI